MDHYSIEQAFVDTKELLVRYTSTYTIEEGEDLVQDFFYKMAKNKNKQFKNKKDFLIYAIASLKNMAINEFVSKSRKRRIFAGINTGVNDPFPEWEQQQVYKRNAQFVGLAIKRLHPGCKQIIELVYRGEHPRDIAKILNKPYYTVRNQKKRAIEAIKRLIKQTNYHE